MQVPDERLELGDDTQDVRMSDWPAQFSWPAGAIDLAHVPCAAARVSMASRRTPIQDCSGIDRTYATAGA